MLKILRIFLIVGWNEKYYISVTIYHFCKKKKNKKFFGDLKVRFVWNFQNLRFILMISVKSKYKY